MEKSSKFVPYEKLAKKSQRNFNKKSRADWGGKNPVSQIFESDKTYNRAKNRNVIDEEKLEMEDDKS